MSAQINRDFGRRLEELLEERGMKKTDLAGLLNVERSTISRYTQGRVPVAATLDVLAKLFGVTTDYLLGRTDDRGSEPMKQETDEVVVYIDGKRKRLSARDMRLIRAMFEALSNEQAAGLMAAETQEPYAKRNDRANLSDKPFRRG